MHDTGIPKRAVQKYKHEQFVLRFTMYSATDETQGKSNKKKRKVLGRFESDFDPVCTTAVVADVTQPLIMPFSNFIPSTGFLACQLFLALSFLNLQ